MINVKSRTLQATFAALAGLGLFMIDDVSPTTSGLFVTEAHAIIGRPATPMSYAGVASGSAGVGLRPPQEARTPWRLTPAAGCAAPGPVEGT